MSLKIKSRLSTNTIKEAEKDANTYGKTVICKYMDEKFKACVIAQN